MANWIGTSRSNYIKVKDADAFKRDMEAMQLAVFAKSGGDAFCVVSRTDDGDWPNIDLDAEESFDIEARIAPHMQEGEICVLMSVGAEGEKYVSGYAIAFDHTGDTIGIELSDIYQFAEQKFGKRPDKAEY